MVKKYKDLDIAVVSRVCDEKQAKRIRKYCKLYIYKGQEIECKVALINYDTSIISNIKEGAKIYEVIHGDYSNIEVYKGRTPPKHERIEGYIAITEYLEEKMKEILNTDKVIMSYNPLTIEEEEKPIILVTASRLHKNKGVERMKALINGLEKAGVNFVWYVISNDNVINNPNVIYIKNRLDVSKWMLQATYCVLLSDSEACSYFINESLYRNIPIISTPLPYLEEIGVKDGLNGYIMKFDCSNVNEIVKKIRKIPKFEFKELEPRYTEILAKGKSHYEEDKNKTAKVRCKKVKGYDDIELGRRIKYREEYIIKIDRAEYLAEKEAVDIIEIYNNLEEGNGEGIKRGRKNICKSGKKI